MFRGTQRSPREETGPGLERQDTHEQGGPVRQAGLVFSSQSCNLFCFEDSNLLYLGFRKRRLRPVMNRLPMSNAMFP